MSNMRKTNNEDSINQNTQNSVGSFSKKSSFRQMTKPLLNTKTISIPRLNELLNDQIFQYYFRTNFNSKDYSKFKYFSENEKINIMIDLYFYIMNKSNNNYIEEEKVNDYDADNENDNNIMEKLFDNLLVLDNNQSRLNVIEKMKEYKLFTLNSGNNYNERFNKILNKYKNGINNETNGDTINYLYNKTDKIGDNINNINNRMNMASLANINYSKPFSTTKFNIKTISNNNADYSPVKYKTQDKLNFIGNYPSNFNEEIKTNNDNDINVYNELISPFKTNLVYDKINIANIKLIKLGKIRKKKININENNEGNKYMEYLLNPVEFEIKSRKNDIEEKDINYLYNNQSKGPYNNNYKKLKPKSKNNLSPYIYENDNKEIIIQEPIVVCQSNIDEYKRNLLLKKQINEGETNELIKKIYQFEGDNISFNKNEINKIGILLLNYIQLEKKYSIIETSLFIYKEKMLKMKEIMQIFTKQSMERINNSNLFIKEQKIK